MNIPPSATSPGRGLARGPRRIVVATVLALLASLMLLVSGAFAADPIGVTSNDGVVPTVIPNGNAENNAANLCLRYGYDNSAKVNYDSSNHVWMDPIPSGITMTLTDDTYLEWTSTFPIGAVIMKAGNYASVYEYIPADTHDSGLASPQDIGSPKPKNLSHVIFCWNAQLKVSKTAATTYTRTWNWNLTKKGDRSSLLLTTGSWATVNYEVTASATSTDSDWAAKGTITITNPNATAAATISSVTDAMGAINGTVTCPVTLPYVLAAGATLTCTYTAALPDATARVNTATVATTGKVPGGSGTADVTFGDPTTVTDECVTVTDPLTATAANPTGLLGTVCSDTAPLTFKYALQVGGYQQCGQHVFKNTATAVTNDTETATSAEWNVTVTVPCSGGCTFTQGYWKTHSHLGPAPYDDGWMKVGPAEESTIFYLSGASWYSVFWTAPAGNPYYILADQYMAAKLNILNGASSTAAVDAAIAGAEAFFAQYTPTSTLSRTMAAKVKAWAATLDQYNNGLIGPGHCSE